LVTKIGVVREQVAASLFPRRQPKEISIMHKGKELNEDMKNLKDLGVGPNDQQITFMISLRTQQEIDITSYQAGTV
jgi:hypothetical protein